MRILCLMLLMVSLMVPGSAQGNDAQAVVLAAFERLETYTFTSIITNETTYTDAAGKVTTTIGVVSVDGNIQANGDRQVTLRQFSGESLVAALASRGLIVEQRVIDGETYVNFGGVEYLEIIEPGWWRYEDLQAQIESGAAQVLIDQTLQSPVPHEYLPAADYIKSVTELPGEEIDGVAMRVFEVEIDAKQLQLDMLPGTAEEKDAELEKNADLIDALEFSTMYRLWLRAEDGRLHHGTVTSASLLPYLTAGGDDPTVSFDIVLTSAGEFEITSYDEETEFIVPELNALAED